MAMKLKKMWLKTPVSEEQAAQAVLDPALGKLPLAGGAMQFYNVIFLQQLQCPNATATVVQLFWAFSVAKDFSIDFCTLVPSSLLNKSLLSLLLR